MPIFIECMCVEVGLPACGQSRSYNENRTFCRNIHTAHEQIYMRAGMRAYTQTHTDTQTPIFIYWAHDTVLTTACPKEKAL